MRAILFDLYDTLAHADQMILDAGRAEIARRVGVDPQAFLADLSATEAARFRGEHGSATVQLGAALRRLGARVAEADLDTLAAIERAAWNRGVQPYDDTHAGLERLRQRGFRLALVSNCAAQSARWIADQRLDAAFDRVILSCDVGALKPNRAIFDAALHGLDIAPTEALFVDDRAEHLDAAVRLGLRAVRIARDQPAAAMGPHPTIARLAELDRWLAAD